MASTSLNSHGVMRTNATSSCRCHQRWRRRRLDASSRFDMQLLLMKLDLARSGTYHHTLQISVVIGISVAAIKHLRLLTLNSQQQACTLRPPSAPFAFQHSPPPSSQQMPSTTTSQTFLPLRVQHRTHRPALRTHSVSISPPSSSFFAAHLLISSSLFPATSLLSSTIRVAPTALFPPYQLSTR